MSEMTHPWAIEDECFAQGATWVCGCDEAGAGPLMGPVYAAAVILPRGWTAPGLNDSKKLTEKRREQLYAEITAHAVAWSVARVEAAEIDATDIISARMKAMQMAIDGLSQTADMALIDGNRDKGKSAAITTPRKLLRMRMAVRAGKMTRLEISMAPMSRIPTTMVSAVSTDKRVR